MVSDSFRFIREAYWNHQILWLFSLNSNSNSDIYGSTLTTVTRKNIDRIVSKSVSESVSESTTHPNDNRRDNKDNNKDNNNNSAGVI